MSNPLLNKYNKPAATAAATPPAAPPAGQISAVKPVASSTPVNASGGISGLEALRAKLAGGFVNPPEAPNAINEDTLAPRTVETPDGGAKPAPGWVEAKNGLVVRAPSPEAAPTTDAPSATELTRGQKAAATRAANKAAKAVQLPLPCTDAPATADESSEIAPTADPLTRIAAALESIARTFEARAL
jgi:hypothetical protein